MLILERAGKLLFLCRGTEDRKGAGTNSGNYSLAG